VDRQLENEDAQDDASAQNGTSNTTLLKKKGFIYTA
jgi:hypothetical protein